MQEIIKGFQLSPQQKRVWLLQQESLAYRSQCAVMIEGALQFEALADAFRKVIGRHEILRTTFRRQPDMKMPSQVIADDSLPAWRHADLSDSPAPEQETRLDEILRQEGERRFDLTRGPLLHLCLIRLSATRHCLSVIMPALCGDANALKNLMGEISRSLIAAGEVEACSTEEPLQYADFSQWQNELLEGEDAQAGRDFWEKQKFTDALFLKLPFEEKLADAANFSPAHFKLVLDYGLILRLRAILPQYEATVADFLRACWQTLLWRHTGQADIVIGNLCSGYKELEAAIGLFAKWLPLTSRMAADSRFSEVLKRGVEASRRAHEWQEYFSWEQHYDAAGNNLAEHFFAAVFEYGEWPSENSSDILKFVLHRQHVVSDRFKVKLCCLEKGQSLNIDFHYDAALLSSKAIGILAEQFHLLLDSAVNNPEAFIGNLELVGDAERQRLLIECNDTAKEIPQGQLIHELFEAQAARTPDRIAIVFEDEQLNYAELNARANQLAHHLRKLGVGPEATVGSCLERSAEMIIAMLAVLKAGGGYVPLEPAQPKERLGYILEDVQPLAVLTQQALVEGLPSQTAKVICLDTDWEDIARESRDNPLSAAKPENLVYVIFTSGSTGRPKGVLVEHRQLVNYVRAVEERLDLSAVESYATVSTFAADLGHTSIFPALCLGGCLHIIAQERASDPDAMAQYFSSQRVELLKIVPSHLEALLASPEPEKVLPRRRLILGGEASRWDLVETVRRLAPDCEVYNHYGPTETTVGAITFHVEKHHTGESGAIVPLGRPIPNAEIYLLDAGLRPVPTGALGELYIGGAGVSRGYLSQPDFTAEKFIPNPFGSRPGARLYRTGDLARFRPDGFVEFVGRADNQVKFHGFRIELNEIRAALNQHQHVRDSVVTMVKDKSGLDVLVAYYVSRQELDSGQLRDFLSATILNETLPSIFVHLKKLPLTLNGKINYRALPTLEDVRQRAKQTFVAPRTPTEQQVAEVWAGILGVERVSLNDNFFEIGGHSLLATRVTTRLREVFHIELPLRVLFEEPTVAGFALAITQMQIAQADEQEMNQMLEELAQLSEADVAVALQAE
jgi:amino acid adenylation domain-containing protein